MQRCNKCSKILPAICMRASLHRLRGGLPRTSRVRPRGEGTGGTLRMLRITRSSQNHGGPVERVLIHEREKKKRIKCFTVFTARSILIRRRWPGAKAGICISHCVALPDGIRDLFFFRSARSGGSEHFHQQNSPR